jgi:osmotically-inducible protein OsmY
MLALSLAVAASGCGREDADKLSRAASVLVSKLRAIAPERLTNWEWNRSSADLTAAQRVRARITSDRFLAPLKIEVMPTAGGVRLRGHVGDDVLKRRAIEMAESTVGVDKVVDELEIDQ